MPSKRNKPPTNLVTLNPDGTYELLVRRRRRNSGGVYDEYRWVFERESLDIVMGQTWRAMTDAHGSVYAGAELRDTPTTTSVVMLHRLINGTPKGQECSFVNHDRTDLRRANLRNSTHHVTMAKGAKVARSGWPQSGYRYVVWQPRRGTWLVCYPNGQPNKGKVVVGEYGTVAEAVEARDQHFKSKGGNAAAGSEEHPSQHDEETE